MISEGFDPGRGQSRNHWNSQRPAQPVIDRSTAKIEDTTLKRLSPIKLDKERTGIALATVIDKAALVV